MRGSERSQAALEAPSGDIRAYLTLMYVVERALDGFLRWAHSGGDAFEPTLHAHLEQIIERRQAKPLLATAHERMVAVRKILRGGKIVTRCLSELAVLRAAVERAENELGAAAREQCATPPTSAEGDEDDEYHLSISVPIRYLEAQIKAETGERRARLLSEEELRRALALLTPIHNERNRIMHGQLALRALEGADGDGLIDRAADLFAIIWKWVHAAHPHYRDEPFPGFRYLALDAGMLRRIVTNGRIASHAIIIDERKLVFLEPGNALGEPKPAPNETLWISEQPRPRVKSQFETLQKAEQRASTSWLKGARAITAADAPALPVGSSDDVFGVPFWQPAHARGLAHIALTATR